MTDAAFVDTADVAVDLEAGPSPLQIFHVLPYRVKSEEWADGSYTKDHDQDGEVVGRTLPELADNLVKLLTKFIGRWAEPRSGDGNFRTDRDTRLRALGRVDFKFSSTSYDPLTRLSVRPGDGYLYPEFDRVRVELRQRDGDEPAAVDLSSTLAGVFPAVQAELERVRERLRNGVAMDAEAARTSALAAKRAQLARLKTELGED